MKHNITLVTLPLTILLSACSGEADEPAVNERAYSFRNAEVYQGRIFIGEENEPYTGIIIDLPISFLDVEPATRLATMGMNTTGDQSTYNYIIESSVMSMMQGGSPAICRAEFNSGIVNGNVNCNTTHKNLPLLDATFDNGQMDGYLAVYSLKNEAHEKLAETHFINGKYHGEFISYGLKSSKPVHTQYLNMGFDDGVVKKYTDDDKNTLLWEMTYESGTAEGVQRQYDPETGDLVSSSYVHRWGTIDNPNNIDLDKCAIEWTEFYRNASEEELHFNYDVLNEYRENCANGEFPNS